MPQESPELMKNIEVSFSIGLDTAIATEVAFDHDGETSFGGQVTLGDVIAQRAAEILAAQIRNEIRAEARWALDPVKIAKEAIEAEVARIVADTLQKVSIETDTFGTPKGEPKTIAEIMQGLVDAWLKLPAKSDNYGRGRSETNLEALLSSVVSRDVAAQITKATTAARDEVLTGLQAKQKEALAAAVEVILTKTAVR